MFLSKTGLLRTRDGVGRSEAGRPMKELGEKSIVSGIQSVEGKRRRNGTEYKVVQCGEPSHCSPTPSHAVLSYRGWSSGGHSEP